MEKKERVYGLDLLRASAIFMVVASHTVELFKFDSPLAVFVRTKLVFFGFTGVELFFVLSGFLIGQILMNEFEDFKGMRTISNFWARRWFRTLPAFYFYLLIYVLFEVLRSRPVPDIISYAFFVQNLLWKMPGFFGQSWSLAVEEWFYLLFPLAALGYLSFFRAKKAVLLAGISMGLLSLIARLYMAFEFSDWNWRYDLRKVCLLRFDSLMLGVLLAYIKIDHRKVYSSLRAWGLWAGICVLLVCYFLSGWAGQFAITRALILFACPLGFALILPWAEALVSPNHTVKKHITYLSEWSYSIYLSNNLMLAIVLITKRKFFSMNNFWVSFLAVVVFFSLTLAVSFVSYWLIERPALTLRDKWFPPFKKV